jgi:hypothetical protein
VCFSPVARIGVRPEPTVIPKEKPAPCGRGNFITSLVDKQLFATRWAKEKEHKKSVSPA